MTGFKKGKLLSRFGLKYGPLDEEVEKIMDEVEEVVDKYYLESSFLQNDEAKKLVMALYSLAIEYVKLQHKYALQKSRIERLLKDIRSLHE